MLQSVLVGLIVVAATVYAIWSLVPGQTRLQWARSLATWGRAQGRPHWIAQLTGRIEQTAAKRQGGCSGCSQGGPATPREHKLPPQ